MPLRALVPLICLWCSVAAAQDPIERAILAFVGVPDGTVVYVNGAEAALEWDARLGTVHRLTPGLAPGQVSVRVMSPSGASARTEAVVDAGSVTTIQFREDALSTGLSLPKVAVGLAAPGVPQLRDGRPAVGTAVLGGIALAVAGAAWTGGQMDDARAHAEAAALRYRQAQSTAEAVAAREAHALAVRNADAARTLRTVAVGVGGALYLGAVLDTILHHADRPVRGSVTASAPRAPLVTVRAAGLGASLGIRL